MTATFEMSDFQLFLIDAGLVISYILLAMAVLVSLVFPLLYLIKYPQEAKRSLIPAAVFIAIVLLSYLFAGNEVLPDYLKTGDITPTASKWIGTGLITMYIILGIAVVLLIYSEIANLFK